MIDSTTAEAIVSLISQGHLWLAITLVFMQLVFMPLVAWLVKHYNAKNKQIIDLERQITKMHRDKEHMGTNHRIDEVVVTSNNTNEALGRVFSKLSELDKKVNAIYTDVEVIKRIVNK